MPQSINDTQITQQLVQQKLITSEQLQECADRLNRDQKRGWDTTLAQILIKKKYVTQQQWEMAATQLANCNLKPPEPNQPRSAPASQFLSDTARQEALGSFPIKVEMTATQPLPGATTAVLTTGLSEIFTEYDAAVNQSQQTQQFGRYQIVKELGRGGMGVVYEAVDPKLKRNVALKIIGQTIMDDRSRIRFEREASLMARLDHTNIVKIFDIGEEHGRYFFTMELLSGPNLGKLLETNLPLPQLVPLLLHATRAVHYAHQQGIIHRDLKPANIMVINETMPKVMDFGLAKEVQGAGQQLSQSHEIVGTPEYMSPEQVGGNTKEIDAQSDVYALGIILYQMLTGKTPFASSNPMNMLYRIAYVEPTPPSRIYPKISKELEAICLKAIEKEKNQRYLTAAQLADDLQNYLDGRPISATPVTPAIRLKKWVRRHRVVTLGVIALALLAIIATFASMYEINRQKNMAVASEQRALASEQRALANERKADANASEIAAKAQEVEQQQLDLMLEQAESALVLAKVGVQQQNFFVAWKRYDQAKSLLGQAETLLSEMSKAMSPKSVLVKQRTELASKLTFLMKSAENIWQCCISQAPHRQQIEEKFLPSELQPQAKPIHHRAMLFPRYATPPGEPLAETLVPSQPSWRFMLYWQNKQETIVVFVWDMASQQTIKTLVLPKPGKPLAGLKQAAFSNDDRFLALGDTEGKLTVWDRETDRLYEEQLPQGPLSPEIKHIAFSRASDLLCAANQENFRIWQLPTMQLKLAMGSGGHIRCAFSANGKWLAVSGIESELLFKVILLAIDEIKARTDPQAKPVIAAYYPLQKRVHSLCFGPEDQLLLAGGSTDIFAFPCRLEKNRRDVDQREADAVTILGAHDGIIEHLALSPDQNQFFSLGQDGRLIGWNTDSYCKIFEAPVTGIINGNYVGRPSILLHPKQPMLGIWNFNYLNLYVWQPVYAKKLDLFNHPDTKQNGRNLGELAKKIRRMAINRNFSQEVVDLAISPGAKHLAYLFGFHLYLWDTEHDTVSLLPIQDLQWQFHRLRFSDDGSLLLLESTEKVTMWEMQQNTEMFTHKFTKTVGGKCLLFQPGTNFLVSDLGDADNAQEQRLKGASRCLIKFWEIKAGKHELRRWWPLDAASVSANAFDPSGTRLAIAFKAAIPKDNNSEMVELVDFKQEQSIMRIAMPVPASAICFSDDNCLALGTRSGDFYVNKINASRNLIAQIEQDGLYHNFFNAIHNIWYDPAKRLFWIQTLNGLFIYPNDIEMAATASRIYPLSVYLGYPILKMAISRDFQYAAMILLSGEVVLYRLK